MARNDGGLVLGVELEDTGWGRASRPQGIGQQYPAELKQPF